MKYLSLCSGIEAASVALEPLGWEPVAFSEIEAFPSKVLKHHYPDVPNLGDMTQIIEKNELTTRPDVLIGGTPCQSFSIAGKRGGLDDQRGQLMLTFVEIAAFYRPQWVVWENVPGCLSSGNGEDFGTLLGALTGRKVPVPENGWGNSGTIEGIDSAYGIAWRVLDAQYFGLAQRRKRVFVIGYLGDWRRASAVLFEQESLSGHPAPRRGKRESATQQSEGSFDLCDKQEIVGALCARDKQGVGSQYVEEGKVFQVPVNNAQAFNDVSPSVTTGAPFSKTGNSRVECDAIVADKPMSILEGAVCMAHGQGGAEIKEELCPTLTCNHEAPIAFQQNSRDEVRLMGGDVQIAGALMADVGAKQQNYIVHGTQDPIVSEHTSHCLGRNNGQENVLIKPALAFEPGILQREGGDSRILEEVTSTLRAQMGDNQVAAAYGIKATAIDSRPENGGNGLGVSEEISDTLTAADRHAVASDFVIRRLTPVECERLQGFPDNYTLIPGKNRPLKEEHLVEAVEYLKGHGFSQQEAEEMANHPDGCRYHALGNSMAVGVIRYLGERMDIVNKFKQQIKQTTK